MTTDRAAPFLLALETCIRAAGGIEGVILGYCFNNGIRGWAYLVFDCNTASMKVVAPRDVIAVVTVSLPRRANWTPLVIEGGRGGAGLARSS
jgi:hypothetical protein